MRPKYGAHFDRLPHVWRGRARDRFSRFFFPSGGGRDSMMIEATKDDVARRETHPCALSGKMWTTPLSQSTPSQSATPS
jgi:hypothetical protein